MATKTKAKAKSVTGKSAKQSIQKTRPIEPPYFPKVGHTVGVFFNQSPFWAKPQWGPLVFADVYSIRDLKTDPLTSAEFMQFATANIGRYLLELTWINVETKYLKPLPEETGSGHFFWNDLLIEGYWDNTESDEESNEHEPQVPVDSQDQPYHRSSLQIVFQEATTFDLGHVYGPTPEDRLRLIEAAAQFRECVCDDDHLNRVRIRPVGNR